MTKLCKCAFTCPWSGYLGSGPVEFRQQGKTWTHNDESLILICILGVLILASSGGSQFAAFVWRASLLFIGQPNKRPGIHCALKSSVGVLALHMSSFEQGERPKLRRVIQRCLFRLRLSRESPSHIVLVGDSQGRMPLHELVNVPWSKDLLSGDSLRIMISLVGGSTTSRRPAEGYLQNLWPQESQAGSLVHGTCQPTT